ncbi:Kinase, AGC [Spironucleus salmonicida]|uniref:Kinase, AGC n=1 Tax=Spironucleus salmonicida TaxID=348837 RepID=V6LKU7_9EUKA|nr:Kinase, AGC [Spironucleus salmonicida]|eukprot:EST41304.1 Kinase, AGC [Spironucleus salmonicida]
MGQENSNLQGLVNTISSIPPATSIQDFQILQTLGQGSFASVFLAKRLADNQTYAIKVLQKKKILEANELTHTLAERQILASLNSPFLVKLHGAFQTSDLLYLVLDFVPGGELFSHLQKMRQFSESVARMMTAQILLGLFELHSHGMIMRDLKPENILVDANGYLKLTDFGLSKIGDTQTGAVVGTTFCGTAEYLSPEQIRNQPHGVEVDYWAVGIICYELIHGTPPFYSRDHKAMFKATIRQDPQFSNRFSESCKSFISRMLEKDPKKRLGAGQNFNEIRNHPFFKGLDWDKLMTKKYEMEYKPEKDYNKNFDKRFTSVKVDEGVGAVHNQVDDSDVFAGFSVDAGISQKQDSQEIPVVIQLEIEKSKEISDFIEEDIPTSTVAKKKGGFSKKKKCQDDDE